MADADVLTRLSNLGITGTRANTLSNTISANQIVLLSDDQLVIMVEGRESGAALPPTGGSLYPDGHLYPN